MAPAGHIEFEGARSLDWYAAVYAYTGRAGMAVRRLKFNRVTSLAPWMASALSQTMADSGRHYDLIVPVPIHWSRRCFRGFNQSELLAEGLAPISQDLLRYRRTRPQVGLTPAERLENLKGAFRASTNVAGKGVLLIDDVITSGSTIIECARALKEAGADHVAALAFAGGPP